jgi:hypothetical protein
MGDASQEWGSDLWTGPTGDLAIASGSTLGQQRILRRLLTNPGDYLWHLDYGAGLGAFVGQTVSANEIAAVIRAQIFNETSVSQSPEPQITVSLPDPPGSGTVFVQIQYTDAQSNALQTVQFNLPGDTS